MIGMINKVKNVLLIRPPITTIAIGWFNYEMLDGAVPDRLRHLLDFARMVVAATNSDGLQLALASR